MTNQLLFKELKSQAISMPALIAGSLLICTMFHVAGMSGMVFLPMFIPFALALRSQPLSRVLPAAIFTPLIQHVVTGMPASEPLPIMQLLTFELILFCISLSWLKREKIKPWQQVLFALCISRCTWIISMLFPEISYKFALSQICYSIPGMLLLTLIWTYKNTAEKSS